MTGKRRRRCPDDAAERARLRRSPPPPWRRLPPLIHALRAKTVALPGLVHRDQLFPRDACRRLCETAMAGRPERAACELVFAHRRGCEADLAAPIDAPIDAGLLPELTEIRERFKSDRDARPEVAITKTPLSVHDALAAASAETATASARPDQSTPRASASC